MSEFEEMRQLEALGNAPEHVWRIGQMHDHVRIENGVPIEDTPVDSTYTIWESGAYVPPAPTVSLHQKVQQAIENEATYPRDAITQEDYMLDRLNELTEQDIISSQEAFEIFSSWILHRRPDTAVIKVKPQPRGYGRGYMNE